MNSKIKKPYLITEDGMSHYDEFCTTLSGELTSIPSPFMPNRKSLQTPPSVLSPTKKRAGSCTVCPAAARR